MELSRQFGRGFGAFAIAVLLIFFAIPGHADAPEINYAGHYELADKKAGRSFSLDVKETKPHRFDVSFSAAMEDGSGSAPDGEGDGRIEDGALSIKWTDSFNNEGTCTLTSAKHGFEFDMVVIKVVDSRPFHFYGNMALKKTVSK